MGRTLSQDLPNSGQAGGLARMCGPNEPVQFINRVEKVSKTRPETSVSRNSLRTAKMCFMLGKNKIKMKTAKRGLSPNY